MGYFSSIIELVDGKFDYDVPDVQQISEAKYQWIPANVGTPGLPQGTCYFDYPVAIGENLPRRQEVTTLQYDNFAVVGLSADKLTINNDGVDGAEVTAQFDEPGGLAYFSVTFPDGTETITEITIDGSSQAVLPADQTSTTQLGDITVIVKSDTWHSVFGFGEIVIESV